jgi:hypothetical protein
MFRQANSHPADLAFHPLRYNCIAAWIALAPLSMGVWWTDRDLASIGFGTFLIVLMLAPFSGML